MWKIKNSLTRTHRHESVIEVKIHCYSGNSPTKNNYVSVQIIIKIGVVFVLH